jgi:hypothetical protein
MSQSEFESLSSCSSLFFVLVICLCLGFVFCACFVLFGIGDAIFEGLAKALIKEVHAAKQAVTKLACLCLCPCPCLCSYPCPATCHCSCSCPFLCPCPCLAPCPCPCLVLVRVIFPVLARAIFLVFVLLLTLFYPSYVSKLTKKRPLLWQGPLVKQT